MSGWGDLKKREMALSYGSTDRILIKLDTHIYLTLVKPKECPSLSLPTLCGNLQPNFNLNTSQLLQFKRVFESLTLSI